MSKTSRSKSKNFEILYYNLKEEYAQLQKDNDEICKEYESTIQMLTDSIKELQNQRSSMTKKLNQIEKEKKEENNEQIIKENKNEKIDKNKQESDIKDKKEENKNIDKKNENNERRTSKRNRFIPTTIKRKR